MSRDSRAQVIGKPTSTTMTTTGCYLQPGTLARLNPQLAATKSTALRLPHRRVQEINGTTTTNLRTGASTGQVSSIPIDPATGRPTSYNKRALPEPKCRCSAGNCGHKGSRGMGTLGQGQCPGGPNGHNSFVHQSVRGLSGLTPNQQRKSLLIERTRSLASAQALASNGYVPSYQKVVTFNLKPSYRTCSAPPLFRSSSLENTLYHIEQDNYLSPLGTGLTVDPDLHLRKTRNLPHPPPYKAPTSPTIPMAKLKLYKDLLAASEPLGKFRSVRGGGRVSPVPRFNLEHSLLYRGSLPGSPSRARPAGTSFFEHYSGHATNSPGGGSSSRGKASSQPDLSWEPSVATPTMSEVTKPPFLEPTYNCSDRYDYNYDNYFRGRRGDLQPIFYQSAPASRPSTPPMSTKYGDNDSPRHMFKKQLKYFVEERKGALGLPGAHALEPQRGSESDLNALLHLYSYPPDPVMDGSCHRTPPAGVSTYQSVPQAYTSPPPPHAFTSGHQYNHHPHHHQSFRKHHSTPSLLGVSPTGHPVYGLSGTTSGLAGSGGVFGYTQAGILRRSPSPGGGYLATGSAHSVDYDLGNSLYARPYHSNSYGYGGASSTSSGTYF